VRVLVLGGTGEARALAAELARRPGVHVVSSLAGRVSDPALPVGEVRIGGFGGVDGLVGYLRDERIDSVIDATHPFARTMTEHAVAAAATAHLPLVVLRRPAWQAEPGDDWTTVADIAEAARRTAAAPAGCVFVTTGRRDLAAFAEDDSHVHLVRAVEPPEPPMPAKTTVLLDRGPYTVDSETYLMQANDVVVLATKNSGGAMTRAKLVAARELGVPVVMVERPPLPSGVDVVETVDAAMSWLDTASV
jgi:precorrin-6A/cobalt-precorrin-6A reductase